MEMTARLSCFRSPAITGRTRAASSCTDSFFAPGRVVLLDLGLVGSLGDADRVMTARTLYAFATGDGPTVARMFYENAPYKATRDYPAYEREVVAVVENLHRRGLGSMQVTVEIGRIFDVLRRHKIHARSHMTMVNLALMAAEGLGKRLAPDLSLTDEALPYLSEALFGAPAATSGDQPAERVGSRPEL